jgi:hypothetical protein
MLVMPPTVRSEWLHIWSSARAFVPQGRACRSRVRLMVWIECGADRKRLQQQVETLSPHLCCDIGLGARDSVPPWARSIRQSPSPP